MRLTISEAAQRLRVSEMTIRRRIRSGELQGVQVNSPGGLHGLSTCLMSQQLMNLALTRHP
jgi:excisionase family DNA binding protein